MLAFTLPICSPRSLFEWSAVYALGFYIDQQAAAKALGEKYSKKSPSALQGDQSLCDGKFYKTLTQGICARPSCHPI